MLRHVEFSDDKTMDGQTPRQWLTSTGQTLQRYLSRMKVALSKRSWGGHLEAAFLVDMLREHRLAIAIMMQQGSDYTVLSCDGPLQPTATIYVLWTGDHYRRARCRRVAAERVAQWRERA